MPMIEDPSIFFNTDNFAIVAVYTKTDGTAIPTKVIINKNTEITSGDAYVTEKVTTIDLIVSDIGTPERGETIVAGVDTYIVSKIVDDDDFVVTVAVRK